MKKHILRAPQTDRYLLEVPTKLSELEDDLPVFPYFSCVAQVSIGPPSLEEFPMSGVTVSANSGFTEPTGNLQLAIPETGIYLSTAVIYWLSTVDSGTMVGRVTTPGTFQLETIAGQASLTTGIDGTYLYDNKLGILTTDPGDVPVRLYAQAATPLNAGQLLAFTAENISSPIDVTAVLEFTIVRIA